WHRHYDPTIGRYTQPDPLGFVDGPSVFAYARNAPGEVVDPEGQKSAVRILLIARNCIKNPGQCKRDLLCPGINKAKDVICKAPGCNRPRSAPPISSGEALLLLRASESCLALRDAEQSFCSENFTSTEKHKNNQTIREQYENKASRCHGFCPDALRLYR
ncbi:MAG: RHS repeat-associated core domain-containing protein, partial [Hyphomicrobium sp.]